MALRAADIAGGDDVDAAAMFDVAGGAVWDIGADLVFVVHGSVVAGETGVVGDLRGEFARFLHVALGALLFEDGVRAAHAAARVDVRVMNKGLPRKPTDREQWSEDDECKPGALERGGALEIIQVNALRHRFGCACSGQWLLAILKTF